MKIAILTNGEYGDYSFCSEITSYDVLICADNGIKHAKNLDLNPDYIIGDFDSADAKELASFNKARIYKANVQKDETDTELALDFALKLNPSQIDIFGGVGTRIDHSLANIHLLYKGILKKIPIRILNPQNVVQLIDDTIALEGRNGDLVSLLPLSMYVSGVYTTGLAYEVINGVFTIGKPYGVSNYMVGEHATISIKEGLLLVMKVKD